MRKPRAGCLNAPPANRALPDLSSLGRVERSLATTFGREGTLPVGCPSTSAHCAWGSLDRVELRTFRTALHEVVRRRLSDIGERTTAPRTHGFDELARLPLRAVGARGNVDP